MLGNIQAIWGGLCGAVTAGYATVTAWANVVITTGGTGLAEVGKKILGQ